MQYIHTAIVKYVITVKYAKTCNIQLCLRLILISMIHVKIVNENPKMSKVKKNHD